MPVVVTGAAGFVGRHLVRELLSYGGEVRAVVRRRDDADTLRVEGAKVAVADLGDEEKVEAAFRDAHTVCHLAGGLDLREDQYGPVNAGLSAAIAEAAAEAGVKRLELLSYPGASPDAANAYLRAKGEAEEAVRASGLDHVILRSTHIYGPGSRWLEETARAASGRVAVVIGPGTQRLAPVSVDDVVKTLAAGDARQASRSGTFGIQGPDVVTADELADLLAGRPRRKLHVSPRMAGRLSRLGGRPLSPTMLEVLSADSIADAPDATAEFGVPSTPLRKGLGLE